MMNCDNCEKKWECTTPCKEAIGWVDLDEKYYDKKYKPVGIYSLDPFGHRAKEYRERGTARRAGGRSKLDIERY